MSGQVIDLSLAAAALRRASAALAPSHDACTRVDKTQPVAILPRVGGPGSVVAPPCHPPATRVQRVPSPGAARVHIPFLSMQYRPRFVECAALVLGTLGGVIVLAIRMAGGA